MADRVSSDNELWDKFRQGDTKALDQVYIKEFQALYNYARKIHSDHDFVIDCIQELFAELWERREHLGEAGSIRFYLLKSIKRKVIKKLNRLNPVTSVNVLSDDYNFKVEYSIEQDIIFKEIASESTDKVRQAIGQLSDRQKEVIYLRFYQNLKFDEISEIMSIKNQSARNLLFEGLSRLKAILANFMVLFISS